MHLEAVTAAIRRLSANTIKVRVAGPGESVFLRIHSAFYAHTDRKRSRQGYFVGFYCSLECYSLRESKQGEQPPRGGRRHWNVTGL